MLCEPSAIRKGNIALCLKVETLRASHTGISVTFDLAGHHVVHLEDPHGFQLLPSSLFVCLSMVPLHTQVRGSLTVLGDSLCMYSVIGPGVRKK